MGKKLYLYYCLEALEEDGSIELSGTSGTVNDDFNFLTASIKDLNRDVEEQKILLELGYHPDGYLIPWGAEGEIITVKEGQFVWNSDKQIYEVFQHNSLIGSQS